MKSASTKLVASLGLVTFGAVLMFVGINWLTFVGLALVVLSTLFSPEGRSRVRVVIALLVCLGIAGWFFVSDSSRGEVFARTPRGGEFLGVVVVWVWIVVVDIGRWRLSRRSSNDA